MNKPKIIQEDYQKFTIRQQIEYKGIIYAIFGNTRDKPNNFNAVYFCSICDKENQKYNSKLIQFEKQLICRRCIQDLADVINEATVSDCKKGRRND